jgi:hypothetical protein
MVTHLDTFSKKNKAKLACPATGAEREVFECLGFHHFYMMGKFIGPGNCMSCMSAGKCPIVHMQKEEWAKKKAIYFSPEPKVIEPSAEIKERVRPVCVIDMHYRRFAVTTEERAAIKANTSPLSEKAPKKAQKIKSKPEAKAKSKDEGFVGTDLAGAVTKMAQNERSQKRKDPAQAKTTKKSESAPESPAAAPTQGMSLLERAKRMKAVQATA